MTSPSTRCETSVSSRQATSEFDEDRPGQHGPSREGELTTPWEVEPHPVPRSLTPACRPGRRPQQSSDTCAHVERRIDVLQDLGGDARLGQAPTHRLFPMSLRRDLADVEGDEGRLEPLGSAAFDQALEDVRFRAFAVQLEVDLVLDCRCSPRTTRRHRRARMVWLAPVVPLSAWMLAPCAPAACSSTTSDRAPSPMRSERQPRVGEACDDIGGSRRRFEGVDPVDADSRVEHGLEGLSLVSADVERDDGHGRPSHCIMSLRQSVNAGPSSYAERSSQAAG